MVKLNYLKRIIYLLFVTVGLGHFPSVFGVEAQHFEYELDGEKVIREYSFGTRATDIPEIPLPKKGESYADPAFGCKVTRISDKMIDKYRSKHLVNIYSTVDIENREGSYLMLGSFKYYLYHATTFRMLKHMGVKPRAGLEWEARWHPTRPNLIYYVWKTQLRVRDVTGPARAIAEDKLVHDFKKEFPEANAIGVATKGTPSVDGRYWTFGVSIPSLGGKHGFDKAFLYDIKQDRLLGSIDCKKPKWVGTSMSGDYMIVAGIVVGRGKGVWAFKRNDLSNVVRLAPGVTHADLAIDCNGKEVYVYENPINDFMEMTDLETGKTTKLISYVHGTSWKEIRASGIHGQHISGNAWQTPGWVLVSTYGGPQKNINARCWKRNVHYMLELKENPRIWRVCHNRSVQGGYWAQAFATINSKGTRAYWGANWSKPDGRLEAYMVELPDNWYEDLMGKKKATELKNKARQTLRLD